MPEWMRRYLYSRPLSVHFRRAFCIGLVARLFSAFFVYGPQALDDYKHGVWPAYQFFAGLPLDLPGYRSHLLVWLLAFFTRVASWFGVESALGQVRAMYFGLALTSLLGIYGTYLYARTRRSRLAAALMLYLVAAFPLMPFISTRAFGEAVALAFVLLGFGALEFARLKEPRRLKWWLLGFLSLGVASLFRFHAGVLFVAYAGVLLYLRLWTGVIAAGLAGITALASEAVIDLLSGKSPLSTLWVYLVENEGGGAKYGVSPWYNTWLLVLALSLAPFSIVFWRKLGLLWRRQWTVVLPWLIFVAAHSLAAHKEERFLYPMVGLELWAVATLWSASAFSHWARRLYTPVFFFVTALGLLVVCFVNSQEGEIEPPAYVQSHYKNIVYLDHLSLFGASRFQFYFLRPPSRLLEVGTEEFNAHRIDDEFTSDPGRDAVVLLTSEPAARDQLRALEGVQTVSGRCLHLREAGSLIDRLLYKMNPRHNQRRRPTWYLICERHAGA
jgi:hypothetical protein